MKPVEDILTEKNIRFNTKGKDLVIKCLNPEHDDAHPSLRIDRLSGVFNCFACGFKGNIYTYFKIKVSLVDVRVTKLKQKIQHLLNLNKELQTPEDALPFNKKYRNIAADTYLKFGAFTCSSIDELKQYLIFPLKTSNGIVIGFCGRAMFTSEGPKYVVYPKGIEKPLFPHLVEPENNTIILVEGIFDAINLHDKGMTNVIALMGLANKNLKNLDYYKLLDVQNIYIMLDPDMAGKSAAEKLKKKLQSDFYVDTIELPEDVDPGDLTKEDVDNLKRLLYENSTS